MKKLFIALIILLFSVSFVHAVTIASGSVTRANKRLSMVNGTAFVDFSAADVLTDYIGKRIVITDSAGKKATGYIKAAGTGETLGDEILDAWSNSGAIPFETFVVSGSDITQAVNTTTSGLCFKIISSPNGKLYKTVNTVYTLNSGAEPSFAFANEFASNIVVLTKGGINYTTGTSVFHRLQVITTTASDFALTGTSLKQVLTPSATGVTITSTPNGATYNWTSIESGFNYNDASGYTYTIESVGGGGSLMLLGVGK